MTLVEKQIELEELANTRAVEKIEIMKGKVKDCPESSPLYNRLMVAIYDEIKDKIAEVIGVRSNQGGNTGFFYKEILNPYASKVQELRDKYGRSSERFKGSAEDVVSYLTAETIVNYSLGGDKPFTYTAMKLSRALLISLGAKPEIEASPDMIVNQAGEFLDVAVNACYFLEKLEGRRGFGKESNQAGQIVLTEEYKRRYEEALEGAFMRLSYFEPMVCMPNDHKDLTSGSGGYLVKHSPLLKDPVKVEGKPHPFIMACNDKSNPRLFSILNTQQKTPYRVDREMYEMMGEIFSYIVEDDSPDSDKFNIFNRTVDVTMGQAQKYLDYDDIYFPLFLDHRGRMYPYCNQGLSYNSDDLGKALIEYGSTMGRVLDSDGVASLKFALGEYLGVSKKVGESRMAVIENALPELIRQYKARDFSFLKGQDAPFGYVSILKELVNYYDDPTGYISHKILHNDACSSGLQLIGLFTGCIDTLKTTNVINPEGDTLEDLYLQTAREVEKTVLSILAHPSEVSHDRLVAASIAFNNEGLLQDRSVVKTPAMTFYNYGAKKLSCYENIVYKMHEKYPAAMAAMCGGTYPDDASSLFNKEGMLIKKAAPVLFDFCEIVWDSMQTGNPTAVAAQKWMGRLVNHTASRDDCFAYISNLNGFPVVLRKGEFKSKLVVIQALVKNPDYDPSEKVGRKNPVWINDKSHKIRLFKATGKIDVKKTETSSIPGIIHGADAAVMMLACERLGYITGIHDSAGCHPNDKPKLIKAIGEVLHTCATSDHFQDIANQCGFTVKPPVVNTLEDFSVIKDALYAFS